MEATTNSKQKAKTPKEAPRQLVGKINSTSPDEGKQLVVKDKSRSGILDGTDTGQTIENLGITGKNESPNTTQRLIQKDSIKVENQPLVIKGQQKIYNTSVISLGNNSALRSKQNSSLQGNKQEEQKNVTNDQNPADESNIEPGKDDRKNMETNNGEPSPDYEIDKIPAGVLKLMQSKTMFGNNQLNLEQEEEEILDFKLDFEEVPVTQGSLDPQVEIQQKKIERCIIRHNSNFRLRWDLYIILLVIYNCIQIPLGLAFQDKFGSDAQEAIGYIVDFCFVCDIIFNFRTTYINEKSGLEILEGKIIAISYIKKWRFWTDIFSVIPFELIYNLVNSDGAGNSTTFKIFDLMKLFRLLRLGRIITYLKFKQDVKIGFRIVYLLAGLLLLVHWVACIWYMIVDGSTWIPPKDVNYGDTDFYTTDMWSQYALVFYYAIILLVGGEVDPMELNQTIVASLVIITGQIVTAFIFGNMAALMAAMNQKDSQFQEQFDSISNLMRAIQLPVNVQEEVEGYLLHIQQVPDMQQDMKVFLKMLSPSLRNSILFHIYQAVIRKISLFDQCSNIELRFLVKKMRTVVFLPDDEVIRQGDTGDKLYFISRGKAEVWIGPDEAMDHTFEAYQSALQKKKSGLSMDLVESFKSPGMSFDMVENVSQNINSKDQKGVNVNSQKFIREQKEGEYFGEISLITHLKRTATIKATDFTTLAYMLKRHFLSSKDEFPQIYQNFKRAIKDKYKDENFNFRQKMIKNVPYFRNLSDQVIQELVYLLKQARYDPEALIVKRGDSTDKIFFLKAGQIDIEVPLKDNNMKFDSLNIGSCFCVFSAFNEDRKQKFNFRAKSVCLVESICSSDIQYLQKLQLELADELKTLRVQIENNEKSEFDFFRYVQPREESKQLTDERRMIIRKKFRIAILRYMKKQKEGQATTPLLAMINLDKSGNMTGGGGADSAFENQSDVDDGNERKHFKALYALDLLEKERKDKDMKLKYLKDKWSNPAAFALSALMGKNTLRKTLDRNMVGSISKENQDEDEEEQDVVQEEYDDNNDRDECDTVRKELQPDNSMISQQPLIKQPTNQFQTDASKENPAKMKKRLMNQVQEDEQPLNDDTIIHEEQFFPSIRSHRKIYEYGPEVEVGQAHNKFGDTTNFVFTSSLGNEQLRKSEEEKALQISLASRRESNIQITMQHKKTEPLIKLTQDKEITNPQLKRMKTGFSQISKMSKISKNTQNLLNGGKSLKKPSQFLKKSIIGGKSSAKGESAQDQNDSITTDAEEKGEDQMTLIQILKKINSSIDKQAQVMAQLQDEMHKRMKKLERKVQVANTPDDPNGKSSASRTHSRTLSDLTSQQRRVNFQKKPLQTRNYNGDDEPSDTSAFGKRLVPKTTDIDKYHIQIPDNNQIFIQNNQNTLINYEQSTRHFPTVPEIQKNPSKQEQFNGQDDPKLSPTPQFLTEYLESEIRKKTDKIGLNQSISKTEYGEQLLTLGPTPKNMTNPLILAQKKIPGYKNRILEQEESEEAIEIVDDYHGQQNLLENTMVLEEQLDYSYENNQLKLKELSQHHQNKSQHLLLEEAKEMINSWNQKDKQEENKNNVIIGHVEIFQNTKIINCCNPAQSSGQIGEGRGGNRGQGPKDYVPFNKKMQGNNTKDKRSKHGK